MDTNTKVTFGCAIAMAIVAFIAVFICPPLMLGTKILMFVACLLVAFDLGYYNHPTSKENCEATGEMRLRKAQSRGVVTGENFYDEVEPIDDEEDA